MIHLLYCLHPFLSVFNTFNYKYWKYWSRFNLDTISYGYGVKA